MDGGRQRAHLNIPSTHHPGQGSNQTPSKRNQPVPFRNHSSSTPDQTAAINVSGADACHAAQDGQHRLCPMLRIRLPGGGGSVTPFHQY